MGGDAEAKLIRVFEYPISQIAWHNERLAVSLDSDHIQVMLFNTQIVSFFYFHKKFDLSNIFMLEFLILICHIQHTFSILLQFTKNSTCE